MEKDIKGKESCVGRDHEGKGEGAETEYKQKGGRKWLRTRDGEERRENGRAMGLLEERKIIVCDRDAGTEGKGQR